MGGGCPTQSIQNQNQTGDKQMTFTNTNSVGKEVYTQMERQAQSKLKRWLNEVRPEYKYLYRQVSGQMCRLVFNQIYPILKTIKQEINK